MPTQPPTQHRHLPLLAGLNIAYGLVGILPGTIVFAALSLTGAFTFHPETFAFLSGLGFVIAFFLVALFLPALIGGILLLKGHPASRPLVLISGILNLLNIPLGTALGIYTFWVLYEESSLAGKTPSEPSPVAG